MKTEDFDKYIALAKKFAGATYIKPTSTGVIRMEANGRRSIYINQSLIKHFYWKNKDKPYCPKFTKWNMIDGNKIPPTPPMLEGLLFESLCIGQSADGTTTIDLPRDKRTGKKLIAQLKIEEQAMNFPSLCQKHGVFIIKENTKNVSSNVQVKKTIQLEDKDLTEKFPDTDIFIHLCADIISPVTTETQNYPVAVIDIKWTGDLESTFGDFGWGNAKYMDHIQAYLYSYLLGVPFVYWVFDKKGRNKFIPTNTDVNSSDYNTAMEAKTRRAEMLEKIRQTVIKVLIHEDYDGWPTAPLYDICKKCPLDCADRNSEEIV